MMDHQNDQATERTGVTVDGLKTVLERIEIFVDPEHRDATGNVSFFGWWLASRKAAEDVFGTGNLVADEAYFRVWGLYNAIALSADLKSFLDFEEGSITRCDPALLKAAIVTPLSARPPMGLPEFPVDQLLQVAEEERERADGPANDNWVQR